MFKIKLISAIAILTLTLGYSSNATKAVDDVFPGGELANHWGRSGIRAYLNAGLSLPLVDTSNSWQEWQTSLYAERHFSRGEIAAIQACKIYTHDKHTQTFYETTDKFFLPSGNQTESRNTVLYWGSEDVSQDEVYDSLITNDYNKKYFIPMSYWSANDYNPCSWLRSASQLESDLYFSLCSYRGHFVYSDYVAYDHAGTAALFKLDIGSVAFAAAASAPFTKEIAEVKRIDFNTQNAGMVTESSSQVTGGMYLKAHDSGSDFQISGCSLTDGTLTIDYANADIDKYIVVCAYQPLLSGKTLVASQKITLPEQYQTSIDVKDWNLGENGLDGYRIDVWLETPACNTEPFAKASNPSSFYGNFGAISPGTNNISNYCIFAEKAHLQCSWGNLTCEVIGNLFSPREGESLHGANPSNQIINFGCEEDNSPLKFWIAGREERNLDGTFGLKADGDFITLYQKESECRRPFNRYERDGIDFTKASHD